MWLFITTTSDRSFLSPSRTEVLERANPLKVKLFERLFGYKVRIMTLAKIGIIGGSGLYKMDALKDVIEVTGV